MEVKFTVSRRSKSPDFDRWPLRRGMLIEIWLQCSQPFSTNSRAAKRRSTELLPYLKWPWLGAQQETLENSTRASVIHNLNSAQLTQQTTKAPQNNGILSTLHPPSCSNTSTADCWPTVLLTTAWRSAPVHSRAGSTSLPRVSGCALARAFSFASFSLHMTFSLLRRGTKALQLTLTITALNLPHTNSHVNKKQQTAAQNRQWCFILLFFFSRNIPTRWMINCKLFSPDERELGTHEGVFLSEGRYLGFFIGRMGVGRGGGEGSA